MDSDHSSASVLDDMDANSDCVLDDDLTSGMLCLLLLLLLLEGFDAALVGGG